MTTTNLALKQFLLSQIKMEICNTPRILVYGPTGSGKSSLIRWLLYYHQDIPFVTVVSPTERFNHTYGDIVPDMFIHDFSKDIIKGFIQRQEFIQDKQKNDPAYAQVDPRAILILDDCLHKIRNIKNDPDVDFLFIAGRWVSSAPIFSIQDPVGLSPTQRGQLSYSFIFYDPLETNKQKLYKHYAGVFPSYKMFSEALEYYTQDFGCLVIDNTNKKSRKLEDKVFWLQIPDPEKCPIPKFKLCDEQFWKMPPVDQIEDDNSKELRLNSNKIQFRRIKSEPLEPEYIPRIKRF